MHPNHPTYNTKRPRFISGIIPSVPEELNSFPTFQVTLERTFSEISVKLKTLPLSDNNWLGTLCNENLNKYSINEIICYAVNLLFYLQNVKQQLIYFLNYISAFISSFSTFTMTCEDVKRKLLSKRNWWNNSKVKYSIVFLTCLDPHQGSVNRILIWIIGV